MISEETPRYNRRSKPPRSLHWVTLTDERFPRLSLTRTTTRGLAHIGPFRSQTQAELVMHSLWDASPIRRCTGPGKGCDFAQLGVCVCPCTGTITEASYAAIVADLITGLESRAENLLVPVRSRLLTLAGHERFEEAARCRDGWEHLSRALRRHRAWTALQRAGTVVAARDDAVVALEHGRLLTAWPRRSTAPMLDTGAGTGPSLLPTSMVDADESALLWTWLVDERTEIVSVTGELALPAHPVPELRQRETARRQGR